MKVNATSTAMATVTAAAIAIVERKGMPMMVNAASAMTTVIPANTTEEPAVPVAIPIACARVCLSMFFKAAANSFGLRSLSPELVMSWLRKRATINSA